MTTVGHHQVRITDLTQVFPRVLAEIQLKQAWDLDSFVTYFFDERYTRADRLALLQAAPNLAERQTLLALCLAYAKTPKQITMVANYIVQTSAKRTELLENAIIVRTAQTMNPSLVALVQRIDPMWLTRVKPYWFASNATNAIFSSAIKFPFFRRFARVHMKLLIRIAAIAQNTNLLQESLLPYARKKRIELVVTASESKLFESELRILEQRWDKQHSNTKLPPLEVTVDLTSTLMRVADLRRLYDGQNVFRNLSFAQGYELFNAFPMDYFQSPWIYARAILDKATTLETARSTAFINIVATMIDDFRSFDAFRYLRNRKIEGKSLFDDSAFASALVVELIDADEVLCRYLFRYLPNTPAAYIQRSGLPVAMYSAHEFETKLRTVSLPTRKRKALQPLRTAQEQKSARRNAQLRQSTRLESKRVQNAYASYVSNLKKAINDYANSIADKTKRMRQSEFKQPNYVPDMEFIVTTQVYQETAWIQALRQSITKLLLRIEALRKDYTDVATLAIQMCHMQLFPAIRQQLATAQTSTKERLLYLLAKYKRNLTEVVAVTIAKRYATEPEKLEFANLLFEAQRKQLQVVDQVVRKQITDSRNAFDNINKMMSNQKPLCLW